jgi:hypothetical protein
MKIILLFTGLITLLTSTGCIVADDGRRYHHHERHEEVRPEVIVGPPEVIVR